MTRKEYCKKLQSQYEDYLDEMQIALAQEDRARCEQLTDVAMAKLAKHKLYEKHVTD